MKSEDIIYVRQIAYQIFEYLKNNPNKKLTKDVFKPMLVNPMDDKKVIIGMLRYEFNLTNEDIQELISNSKVNEEKFFSVYTRLENTINSFFLKEISNLKEGNSLSGDMDLQNFRELDENDPMISDEKIFSLDLSSFLEYIKEKKILLTEINLDRYRDYNIVNFIDIVDFWRYNTPNTMIFKEFLTYLENYELENEEKLIVKKISIENEVFYIFNKEILLEEDEEDFEDEDFEL